MKVVFWPINKGRWPFESLASCTVSVDSGRIHRTYDVDGILKFQRAWDLKYDGKTIQRKSIEIKEKLSWLPQIRIIRCAYEIKRDGEVIATIKPRGRHWRYFDFDCGGRTFEFTNTWRHPFLICRQLDMKQVDVNAYTLNETADELDPDAIAMLCVYWRESCLSD